MSDAVTSTTSRGCAWPRWSEAHTIGCVRLYDDAEIAVPAEQPFKDQTRWAIADEPARACAGSPRTLPDRPIYAAIAPESGTR